VHFKCISCLLLLLRPPPLFFMAKGGAWPQEQSWRLVGAAMSGSGHHGHHHRHRHHGDYRLQRHCRNSIIITTRSPPRRQRHLHLLFLCLCVRKVISDCLGPGHGTRDTGHWTCISTHTSTHTYMYEELPP